MAAGKRDEILNNFRAAAIVGTYGRCIQLLFRSFQQLACVSLTFILVDGSWVGGWIMGVVVGRGLWRVWWVNG